MAKKPTLGSSKKRSIEEAKSLIEKAFPDSPLLNGTGDPIEMERIKSGSRKLDDALGGGWAKGRIVEIYGKESSGKTTLALEAIASEQKNGGLCVFLDMEHALDLGYAKSLGVDTEALLISQPTTGEQALEMVHMLSSTGSVSMIVIDSVAALTPRAEIEGNMGDSLPGLQARMMGQGFRKFTGPAAKTKTTLVFINQTRVNLAVTYGSKVTTSGGNALKFYASQRVDVRRVGSEKDGDEFTANNVVVKVVKNKTAPPFKEAEFDIEFGVGIDSVAEIISISEDNGCIEKGGAWYTVGSKRIQGAANLKSYLKNNKKLLDKLDEMIDNGECDMVDWSAEMEESDEFIADPNLKTEEKIRNKHD